MFFGKYWFTETAFRGPLAAVAFCSLPCVQCQMFTSVSGEKSHSLIMDLLHLFNNNTCLGLKYEPTGT